MAKWIHVDAMVDGGRSTERCLINLDRLDFISPDRTDDGKSCTVVTIQRGGGETMDVCLALPFDQMVGILDALNVTQRVD